MSFNTLFFSRFYFGTTDLEAHKENNWLNVAEFSQQNENHVTKYYLTFHGCNSGQPRDREIIHVKAKFFYRRKSFFRREYMGIRSKNSNLQETLIVGSTTQTGTP